MHFADLLRSSLSSRDEFWNQFTHVAPSDVRRETLHAVLLALPLPILFFAALEIMGRFSMLSLAKAMLAPVILISGIIALFYVISLFLRGTLQQKGVQPGKYQIYRMVLMSGLPMLTGTFLWIFPLIALLLYVLLMARMLFILAGGLKHAFALADEQAWKITATSMVATGFAGLFLLLLASLVTSIV